jgi:hypothetical protein
VKGKSSKKNESHFFSFMNNQPQLAEMGEEIEQHLFSDPHAVLVKARVYAEQLTKIIMDYEKLEEVYELKHVERLHKLLREELITEEIHHKFDWIRKTGNKAAHETDFGSIEHALKAHRYLYELSVWYQETYGEWNFQAPSYRIPQPKPSETINKDELSTLISQAIQQILGKTVDQTLQTIHEELKKIQEQSARLMVRNDSEEQPNQSDNKGKKEFSFDLVGYLTEKGLEIIDKRKVGGALWVVGGWELNEVLFPLKEHKIYFRFTKKGGRSTKNRPAWFLLGKYDG